MGKPKATTLNRPTRRRLAKTKLPVRTVKCDDLELEQGGKTYRPHYGETVTFAGGTFVQALTLALDLAQLRDLDQADADNMEQVEGIRRRLDDAVDLLSQVITAWTWTDAGDKPYPDRPTPIILRTLVFEELLWLVGASMPETTRTEASRKNGSSP